MQNLIEKETKTENKNEIMDFLGVSNEQKQLAAVPQEKDVQPVCPDVNNGRFRSLVPNRKYRKK